MERSEKMVSSMKRNAMEDDYYAEVESAPRSSARSGALPLEAGRTLQTVLERGSSTLVLRTEIV